MQETKLAPQNFNRRYYETLRRAGTLAALGDVAIRASHLEELKDYERRQYDETHSALVEGLKGTVSTHYAFELKDGKLVAIDGEDIEELLVRGVDDALEAAAEDEFFAQFLPQRAVYELEEHRANQAMARGEVNFNTNIAISPYTEELADSELNRHKLIRGAQKPYWQRAMLRLSHWDGQQLHVFTRSIDNSSVEILKETAKQSLGYEYSATSSTEMLGERIRLNINDSSWEALPDDIVAYADAIIASRFGRERKQGRLTEDAKNLDNFVDRHSDVVRHLIGVGRHLSLEHDSYESYKQAFESEMYKHMALLETRLELDSSSEIIDIDAAACAAGAIAQAEGRVYDMCGMVISAHGQAESVATQTGYESLRKLEGKKISCPECKSRVVVPKEDLAAGELSCKDCGYRVDACTGRKIQSSRPSHRQEMRQPDFFDILSLELQRHAEEVKQKRQFTDSKKEINT